MQLFKGPDFSKLMLRVSVSVLMLFHGVEKVVNGIDMVKSLTIKAGFPEFVAYGVYLGEVVAPMLIFIGLYTRYAAFVLSVTMLHAIYLAHFDVIFKLNQHGAPLIELPLLYLMLAVVILINGAGKYSIDAKIGRL